jgi:hypothetical protein
MEQVSRVFDGLELVTRGRCPLNQSFDFLFRVNLLALLMNLESRQNSGLGSCASSLFLLNFDVCASLDEKGNYIKGNR